MPVNWQCSKNYASVDNSTQIFIGIFTTAKGFERRQLIRNTYLQHIPDNVMYKFVMGNDAPRDEIDTYHDILPLDIEENMNEGKTYEYFKLMADVFRDHPVDFVLKADDDSYLYLDRLYQDLSRTPKSMSYWGFLVGNTFMGGECYGLSFDLVQWVATNEIAAKYKVGHEDSQVQKWFDWSDTAVDYQIRNCRIHDYIESNTVYSKHIDLNASMVVHALKTDDHFMDVHTIMEQVRQ
ncbi:hypothetical protein DM01DRAFT_1340283 [Hesseltinella vesiculosa]|uniref:Hexosyltransferase n=1 Tax=Hesseltinella vesiculosa TaxID=101127 RepID=A0A1X2G4L0_9FUNG|nr:hypothetical protein DM01DRAFT_1340283 [Hesseltinella vesiculosa]